MNIVIHTIYVDRYGYATYGSNSFTNNKDYTSQEVERLLRINNLWDSFVPSLYFMQNLENNENIFLPPNGERYTIGITEISLNYILPQDTYETGKDISELIKVVTKKVEPTEVLEDLLNKAFVELDQRINWIEKSSENKIFANIPGIKKVIANRKK